METKEKKKSQRQIRCDFCHRLISFAEAERVSEEEHHRRHHGYCTCGNHLFNGELIFGGKVEVINV